MNFIEFEKCAAWERCALKSSRWLYELCCCGWLPGRCEELALIPTLGEHFFSAYPFFLSFFFTYLFILCFQNKDGWKGTSFVAKLNANIFVTTLNVNISVNSEFMKNAVFGRIHEKYGSWTATSKKSFSRHPRIIIIMSVLQTKRDVLPYKHKLVTHGRVSTFSHSSRRRTCTDQQRWQATYSRPPKSRTAQLLQDSVMRKIIIMLHYQHGLRCAESRIQMALQAMVPAASMLMLDLWSHCTIYAWTANCMCNG